MTDNLTELTPTSTTFSFASGQVVTLDQNQIEKIPYLSAIVSSGDRFESARDENAHYKLDPNINFIDFSFVIESLSFRSVRQLFTCLPKENDAIPIIALLDFLGLGLQPDPTLKEVDATFFSSVVYNPVSEKHLQIVRPSVVQDIAVRFAIAIVKEEYDFKNRVVIDQIYWFTIFILGAHKLFGPRLRHHVLKTVENCFSLFEPSQVKPLMELKQTTDNASREPVSTTTEYDIGPDGENFPDLERLLDLDNYPRCFRDDFDWHTRVFFNRRTYLHFSLNEDDYSWWCKKSFSERDLLEPTSKRVLEIMYERLQSQICQHAAAVLHENRNKKRIVPVPVSDSVWYIECETLPSRIENLFKTEAVQAEIRGHILDRICILVPKLEQRHKLLKVILKYDEISEYEYVFSFRRPHLETMQKEAICHQLLLDKLDHCSNVVVEQIQQRVFELLCISALKQFNLWLNTERDIDELSRELRSDHQRKESSFNTCKIIHKKYQKPIHKSVPKCQLKYSKH